MDVCQYFLRGDCRFGDKCRMKHPSDETTTVCPYFLRGNCRYGDKCHYEHPRDRGSSGFSRGSFRQSNRTGGQWGNSSFYSQNRFEALSGNQKENSADRQQIQQTVKNDMEIWQKSKQWPLSCYTYTKEEPSFPGLLDFSPEEIRLEAYTANSKGNANAYEQGLKQLIHENFKRRLQLSEMTLSAIQEEIKKTNSLYPPGDRVSIGPSSSMPQPTSSHVFGTGSSFGGSLSFQSSGPFADRGQSNSIKLFNAPTTGLFSGQIKSSTGQSTGFPSVAPSSQPSAKGGVLFGSSPIARSSGLGSSVSKVENDNSVVSESVNVTANAQKSPTTVSTPSNVSPHKPASSSNEEGMEAFLADSFVLGKIPEFPPPLELC
ncbi:LOW QUALITY PROTEIN: nucleoporin NUP42-like [Acropora millepora]|uniref:LOW QUALITY PROTEIN: nucleoporin NUP42-like n=1 Tax=Acropora millepora TaxID=45264 RepID=UPI001CF5A206|nr:LOW QUALITY PROTEIN: nucleoporin NUP42-like [Acropora millepora]